MDPINEMSPFDQVIFKIKMDIMMVKTEVKQMKDELINYFDSILNLHLDHFKKKIGYKSPNRDCELGLYRIDEEKDFEDDGESCDEKTEESEESINEDDLIFNDDVFKNNKLEDEIIEDDN